MIPEDELVPISALQHVLFCERQYALIHLEQVWQENQFTAEGRVLHERVDVTHHESRRLFRQEYGMAVRSLQHGLIGKCDLVELFTNKTGQVDESIPVEFKRGANKDTDVDRVQLCAQAFCLEEMLGIPVKIGQFYYLREHRRTTVEISDELRNKTTELLQRIRAIGQGLATPVAVYAPARCDRCSLIETCMPKTAGAGRKQTNRYIESQVKAARAECVQ